MKNLLRLIPGVPHEPDGFGLAVADGANRRGGQRTAVLAQGQ
jgi:hypothetical protein